ncbi:hypothetical protein ACPC54_30390 [Kitasatospora sp. NPDC094028]
MDTNMLLRTFYTVERAGSELLSDGGGPLGFDIQVALQLDYLIRGYQVDGIVETGCCLGDTTVYLARMYPDLPVITCDVDPDRAALTAERCRTNANVRVLVGDSAELLPQMMIGFSRPLVYLDAHWGKNWPLVAELRAVQRGVIAVDDFNIGHPRFGYDTYDGVDCGPALVRAARRDVSEMYVSDPYGSYPLPCLQVGRRRGVGYIAADLPATLLAASDMFRLLPLSPEVLMPSWPIAESFLVGGRR